LEYTFTRPDIAFKPSEPLTSSLLLAAGLIREAVKFTPVRPHSLHVTLQIDQNSKKLPKIGLGETLFLMLCTGHFVKGEGGVYESRLTEGNMKDWAVIRDRKNDSGWVITVEFTHMRVCRGFVKRDVYEPAILLFLAYKNLFNLEDAGHFYRELTEWAKAPYLPDINTEFLLKKIKEGLDKEVSLPEYYKNKALEKIYALYKYNLNLLKDNC